MMRHWNWAVLALAFLLLGCPYRQALRNAEDLEAQQQWREAVAAYQDALRERPDSEDARDGLGRVTPFAVQDAIADGRTELAAQRFEGAMAHHDYVIGLSPGHSDAINLANDVFSAMISFADDWIGQGAMAHAYEMTWRADQLFPGATQLTPRFETCRAHFYAESDRLLDLRQYEESLEQLAVVSGFEPGQNEQVAARAQRARAVWADEVVGEASEAEAAELFGAAASLYARAYEIAARGPDLRSAHTLTRGLQNQGLFGITLTYRGDPARTPTARHVLDDQSARVSGAFLTNDATAAWLTADVELGGARCGDARGLVQGSQDYLAGYNEYDNPEYLRLREEIGYAERRLSDLEGEHWHAQSAANRDREELRHYEGSTMQPIWSRQTDTRSRIQSLEVHVDGARGLVGELERQIADAERRGVSQEALLASRMTLGAEQERLITLENELVLAQRELNDLNHSEQSADYELQRRRHAASVSDTELERVNRSIDSTQQEIDQLTTRRDGTSPTIVEEIWDTFHFDVTEVTRTCSVDQRVHLSEGWGGRARTTLTSARSWYVVDRTHPAYPEYGVVGDPLAFSLSDSELVANADGEAAAELASHIAGAANAFYDWWWRMGAEQVNVEQALDYYLTVYLAAPDRVDQAGQDMLYRHISETYGLTDLALLFP